MYREFGEDRESPEISDSLTPGAPQPSRISDSPAGNLLQNFLEVINLTGEDAQENYESALKELRERADEVVIEIARAEQACDPEDYPFRWALVHAAAELRHASALPFLRNIVLTPIPPERSRDPHSFSTAGEETILRTTAIEGVEYLADQGNEEAQEALFDFLKIDSLSIRRASVQAILATIKDRKVLGRMRELIPQDQHFLLEIKRIDVKDAPQIQDPQRHLTEKGREAKIDPPPRIPGEPEGDAPKAYQ